MCAFLYVCILSNKDFKGMCIITPEKKIIVQVENISMPSIKKRLKHIHFLHMNVKLKAMYKRM